MSQRIPLKQLRAAARQQPLVSAAFIAVPFPDEAATEIIVRGGKPVCAKVFEDGSRMIVVMVSDDPSGPKGQMERHASVSARTRAGRRMPSGAEVAAALEAVEMLDGEQTTGKECIHAWKSR